MQQQLQFQISVYSHWPDHKLLVSFFVLFCGLFQGSSIGVVWLVCLFYLLRNIETPQIRLTEQY